MQKFWKVAVGFAFSATFVTVHGCGNTVIEGIDRARSTELTGSKGPWGQCQYADEEEFAPSICPDKGPNGEKLTCTGSYTHRTYEDSPSFCEASATCQYVCDSDADCPLPESGTAKPVCAFENCILPCEDGQTCPAGMTCWNEHGAVGPGARCAWVYEGCPPGT